MILRLWHGVVHSKDATEYIAYQEEVGPPGYRKISGHLGTYMLGRDLGDRYEVSMLTFWESWDAIRAFAGDPMDRARYYDRDFDFLIDPPKTVLHYEVLAAANVDQDTSRRRSRPRILRLWRGPVFVERIDDAIKSEIDIGFPGYQRVDGNRGIYLIGRDADGHYEIGMLTFWESRCSSPRWCYSSSQNAVCHSMTKFSCTWATVHGMRGLQTVVM